MIGFIVDSFDDEIQSLTILIRRTKGNSQISVT